MSNNTFIDDPSLDALQIDNEVRKTLRREKINASIRYFILLGFGLLALYPLFLDV